MFVFSWGRISGISVFNLGEALFLCYKEISNVPILLTICICFSGSVVKMAVFYNSLGHVLLGGAATRAAYGSWHKHTHKVLTSDPINNTYPVRNVSIEDNSWKGVSVGVDWRKVCFFFLHASSVRHNVSPLMDGKPGFKLAHRWRRHAGVNLFTSLRAFMGKIWTTLTIIRGTWRQYVVTSSSTCTVPLAIVLLYLTHKHFQRDFYIVNVLLRWIKILERTDIIPCRQ